MLNTTPNTVPISASRIVSPIRPRLETSVSLGCTLPVGALVISVKV
jgi:hypothetical protein